MKTAIISDIHGNYPALEAVINDAEKNNVDQFVFIGDYVFDVPFSREVVNTIRGLENSHITAGNKEVFLAKLDKEDQLNWTSKQMGAAYQTYREMDRESIDFLIGLPDEMLIPIGGGKTLYATHYFKGIVNKPKIHATSFTFHKKMLEEPFSHEDFLKSFEGLFEEEEWRNEAGKIDADVIAFGHNHLQAWAYCKNKLIVNPGSCGQPLDFDNRAAYAILDVDGESINVIEKRVSYNILKVIEEAKKTDHYKVGRIWLELCFHAMKTGRDYFGFAFSIAREIHKREAEADGHFNNETWEEMYEIYKSRYGSYE